MSAPVSIRLLRPLVVALLLQAAAPLRAELTIDFDLTVDGGELNVNAPGLLVVDGAAGPVLTLTNGASVFGAGAVAVGGADSGALIIGGGTVLENIGAFAILGSVAGQPIGRGMAVIGVAAGSTGTATVTGADSQWTTSEVMRVGNYGQGSLNILDGGRVDSASGDAGFFSGGQGTATVSGEGSTWKVNHTLQLGWGGTGALVVADGGAVSSYLTFLGVSSSGIGQASIAGADTVWTTTDMLVLGHHGQGSFTAASGGRVVSNRSFLAWGGDASVGSAVVTGPESLWTLTNDLILGYEGQGTLSVADGGTVVSRTGYLAHDLGSTGVVSITGAGSRWTVTNSLYVGGDVSASGGTATLHVADGGALDVGGALKLWNNGTLDLHSGGTLDVGTLDARLGVLNLAGGTLNVRDQLLVADDVTLDVAAGRLVNNGTIAAPVALAANAVLGGSGVVAGVVSGAGTVGPGNSPGVLDVLQLDPTSGLDVLFEFTAANTMPDFLNRTASINDVLHITHATNPFLAALTPDNVVTVDFQVAALNDGDVFYGGFFTNLPGDDFYGDGTVQNALYNYLLNGSALDLNQWQVTVSTSPQFDVNFGAEYGGLVDGRLMQFTLQHSAVPEPGSLALCGTAAAGWLYRRRRKKTPTANVPDSPSPQTS